MLRWSWCGDNHRLVGVAAVERPLATPRATIGQIMNDDPATITKGLSQSQYGSYCATIAAAWPSSNATVVSVGDISPHTVLWG